MKLQSAIEFLSTYSFMFLLVGILLIIIFYFAFPAQNIEQSQCSIFGSMQCNYVIFQTNVPSHNANVIFSITDSGSAPINVIGANVIISSNTFVGSCAPKLMVPGGNSICSAIVAPAEAVGTRIHGYLYMSVNYCNSDVSQFGNYVYQGNCTYSPIYYSGEFFTYSSLLK